MSLLWLGGRGCGAGQARKRRGLQPGGERVGAVRREPGLHVGAPAECEGIETFGVRQVHRVRRRALGQLDLEARQRAEAIGQPGFRIRDAGQIDLGGAGAMA